MSLLVFAIIASAVIKAIMFLVYLYLYLHYRERFLGLWTLAWGLILLKSFLDPFIFSVLQYIPVLILFHALGTACLFFLAWGTCDFVGKKLPKLWVYAIVLTIAFTDIGAILRWPTHLLIIPSVILYSVIYIGVGIILLKDLDTLGLGKKITAYAFILNGLHQLDFPLFRPTDMAPWGYLLDSSLRLIIAIGFLLAYFEKTRYDLSRKEQQFRLLAENARDIIYRYQLAPRPGFEYISPVVEELTGYKPQEFYDNPRLIAEITHSDDRHIVQGFTQAPVNDGPASLRLLTKNNTLIWAEQQVVAIRDNNGQVVASEGIIRDITARKQLEQELFRLDRLNIVGQMAANIGHEIRNPLTTVRGYLQVMSRKKDLEAYRDNFALLLNELDRTNSLITEYLSLSKNRLTDQRLHSLNAIIESLFPLLQADAAATNHLVRLELGDTPDLLLDEKEIRQLILNLTRNGLEAMAPGKTLTIKTCQKKDCVVLSIQDQGQEIPAATLEKLGLPFFTTKENGTGLGLAICYSIANRHRAKVEVTTGPLGTTFAVSFPRKD